MNTARLVAPFAAAATILGSGVLVAGPLTPPAGVPSSTPKTLQEVEPRLPINNTNTPGDATSTFRINQPGHYYLAFNVGAVPGRSAITIAAKNVTLDLNGFTVGGLAGSVHGITFDDGGIVGSVDNATITNGNIRSFGGSGIHAPLVRQLRIDRVAADTNGAWGFNTGVSAVITGSVATGNTLGGFQIASSSIVEACFAASNQGPGYLVGKGSQLTACRSLTNTGNGYEIVDSAILTLCTSRTDGRNGIECTAFTDNATVIAQASIVDPTGSGSDDRAIKSLSPITLSDSTINNNFAGVESGLNSAISCTALVDVNTGLFVDSGVIDTCAIETNTSPSARAIDLGQIGPTTPSGTIRHCAITSAGPTAILASGASVIVSNAITATGASAIIADGSALIRDNTLRGATTRAINVASLSSRIEDNNITDSPTGIQTTIANARAMVARNTFGSVATPLTLDPTSAPGTLLAPAGGAFSSSVVFANFAY